MPQSVMLGFVNEIEIAAAMVIIKYLPKRTKAIPAPLTAITEIYLLVNFLGRDTKTVGNIAKV